VKNGTGGIIVALDVDNLEKAKSLVESLAPHVGCFKIGLELITSVGAPGVVISFTARCRASMTASSATSLTQSVRRPRRSSTEGQCLNVHASCGIEAMMAAVATRYVGCLAVTVLTSLEENNAHLIFGGRADEGLAVRARCQDGWLRWHHLFSTGLDSSKAERAHGLLKVSPGVRSEWAAVETKSGS